MAIEPPNLAYYRAVEGAWAAPLEFVVTDWRAFWAGPMGLIDRLSLLAMLCTSRLFGAFLIETSVDATTATARDQVIHTTRVTKWGMTLLRSTETLSLSPNGRDLSMRIELRVWPTRWRVRAAPPAPATVDATAHHATYRFPWFGTEMRQRAERSADGSTVTLTQETDFLRGVQVLRRR